MIMTSRKPDELALSELDDFICDCALLVSPSTPGAAFLHH
ncbi:hypothetical protein JCM19239_4341 [Vibrio variabilis]|uniref:Uncharacterized protein n=1 Tax=Vibrio variabilis TaxID=990271 RepID=A0ABQ0JE07_9VIBR|nr:hypothetical protein JCM19239_4341 [Vibrio variabilis]